MAQSKSDPMSGMKKSEAKYNNLKFGKVGDWFKGTLAANNRTMENQLSAKRELQTIFEFKAHGGSFHNIVNKVVDDEPTIVQKDDFWSFITGKDVLLNQLKDAKLGQEVGLRYAEEKEAKKPGHNPAKIIEIYLGKMDPNYQGETSDAM